MKCKACGKEIGDQCQQGGVHIKCYGKEISVFRVYEIEDPCGTNYVEKELDEIVKVLKYISEYYVDLSGIAIRCTTMTQGEYYNLPKFEGF